MHTTTLKTLLASGSFLALTAPAIAGAHTWRVNELFSNADGTVQFIELRECCGGNFETNLNNLQVVSQMTGNSFTFPANLDPPTGNKHILLATQSFADLPGSPTPDHIIPQNFFEPGGDAISYHVYDTFTFGAGDLPTDCFNSLQDGGSVAPNTPTNYADESGQVDGCGVTPGDLNNDGAVDGADLAILLGAWGPCSDCDDCPADLDDSCAVDGADLAILLGNWAA